MNLSPSHSSGSLALSASIDLRLVSATDGLLLAAIRQTLERSFPLAERRDFDAIEALLVVQPAFTLYALMCDGRYVGCLSAWHFDAFTFVEHFALDPAFRNGGIGAAAMRLLLSGQTAVVLEVEPPADELACRRIDFYTRLGFALDARRYLQPPYRKGDEPVEMRLMRWGGIDLTEVYDDVVQQLYGAVYGVDEPLFVD